MKYRKEKDSLGEKKVPLAAYYGVETVRALENYPISGVLFHSDFIWALAQIKKACALANQSTGRLEKRFSNAIVKACNEVIAGQLRDQFVTDVLQSGAGVSAHMNANEVIAHRASEILSKKRGIKIRPHDHVNKGQSTNDVIPTAIRLSSLKLLKDFYAASRAIEKAFLEKSREFKNVVKAGRTHMQDAAPLSLGQEFGGWARQLEKGRERIERLAQNLLELGIGGSAVGTGLNTTQAYNRKVIAHIKAQTGFPVRQGENLFELMQSDADLAAVSGGLRDYALSLIQISHDIRLLSSGPQTGFAEIQLPPRQPGSSIMPGKVNPVMLEVASQVAYQVIGNDTAIAFAVSGGQLELNVMRPVIAHNLLQSVEILKNLLQVLRTHCIVGIQANRKRCRRYAEESFGIAASLNPYIGYKRGAECVQEAKRSGKLLRQVVLEKGYLTKAEINRILFPENMISFRKK